MFYNICKVGSLELVVASDLKGGDSLGGLSKNTEAETTRRSHIRHCAPSTTRHHKLRRYSLNPPHTQNNRTQHTIIEPPSCWTKFGATHETRRTQQTTRSSNDHPAKMLMRRHVMVSALWCTGRSEVWCLLSALVFRLFASQAYPLLRRTPDLEGAAGQGRAQDVNCGGQCVAFVRHIWGKSVWVQTKMKNIPKNGQERDEEGENI